MPGGPNPQGGPGSELRMGGIRASVALSTEYGGGNQDFTGYAEYQHDDLVNGFDPRGLDVTMNGDIGLSLTQMTNSQISSFHDNYGNFIGSGAAAADALHYGMRYDANDDGVNDPGGLDDVPTNWNTGTKTIGNDPLASANSQAGPPNYDVSVTGHGMADWGLYDEYQQYAGAAGCFPAEMTVQKKFHGNISISKLLVGDIIMTPSGWSQLYGWLAYNDPYIGDFIKLSHKDGVIKISPGHYILVNNKMIAAKNVIKGDILQYKNKDVVITSVTTESCKGTYAPVTRNGTLLVNDVTCSSFSEPMPPHKWSVLLSPLFQLLDFITFGTIRDRVVVTDTWLTGTNVMLFMLGILVGRIKKTKFTIKKLNR